MESMESTRMPRRPDQKFELPWGFRFHPTDEELINYYLVKKVLNRNFCAIAIAEADLNKSEPWDLPGLAKMGETEWYFFCVRDRKYPSGERTNRATHAGYWKATGKDKEICMGDVTIGMKKTLVFYKGRAPKGEKTNWVMHEYRLEATHSEIALPQAARPLLNEWTICRVFEKCHSGKKVLHDQNVGKLKTLGPESTPASQMTPLMDSHLYASETKTTPGELSQVTCFSDPNQVEDRNNTHDDIVDSRETPILKISSAPRSSVFSPVSWGFAKEIPEVPNSQSTQIAHQIGNPQSTPNCTVPQQPPMMGMVMENHGSSAWQSQRAESSQGRDIDADFSSLLCNNNDMFYRFFGNQGQPSASADIDSLWNY